MQAITGICDEAACILVDPLNAKYSSDTHYIACALAILLGVATYGIAQAVSVVWRTLRQIEENETLDIIGNLFRDISLTALEDDFDPNHTDFFDDEPAQGSRSEQFYKDKSIYSISDSGLLSIGVIKKGIKEVPDYHLQQLAYAIEKGTKAQNLPHLKVQFLREDLHPLIGIDGDGGGLSRDFLDDLFEGIVQNSKFSFLTLQNSSLVLPQTKKELKNDQLFSQVDKEELALYQAIGIVMMFCYSSNLNKAGRYLIGRRFAETMFKAILCLTAEEINTSFAKLSIETKMKMCQSLLDGHQEGGIDLNYLQTRCDWLRNFDHLNSDELLEAAISLQYSELLPNDFTLNQKGEEPDIEHIQQNLAAFKEMLIDSIFCQKGVHGQFGVQLAPIHAIAQGMKSFFFYRNSDFDRVKIEADDYWNSEFYAIDYEQFSRTLQGVFDRNQIVQFIPVNHDLVTLDITKQEIEKKLGWLHEWILDEENGATEDELKKLLKFMIGSTSIQQSVLVGYQYAIPYYPVPVVNTCSFQMLLAPTKSEYGQFNDHTKENFIESLRELVLKNPASYQKI